MISEKDKKFLKGLVISFGALFILYFFVNLFSNATGRLTTEYALQYTQVESIEVDSFAVRDENPKGNNSSVFLYKNNDLYYVPLVTDSANVAKNDTIAISFSNESSASAYVQRQEVKEKIEKLKQMKSQGELSYLNVVGLNSLIYSSVNNYITALNSGSLEHLNDCADNFTKRITTKQIATGEEHDFDSQIELYKSEYESLKASSGNYTYVKSPYAGYFVSKVDGYENTVSYLDVENKKTQSGAVSSLKNATPQNVDDVFGKVVSQYKWYLLFDINENESSSISYGNVVYVDFPHKDIEDVKMTVYDISESKNGVVTVVLQCKMMNEDLITLRHEKAVITLKEYTGLKINKDAIHKTEDGLDGVYVLTGNYIRFSPINIKYYADDYVIADKHYIYKKDKDGNTVVDEEKTALHRAIRVYDNIIVKGKNLEDGKVVN